MSETPTAADRVAKFLESWKVIALAIVALVLIGIRFETWQGSLARASDVDDSMRTLKIDLKSDLTLIREQLFEIARTTGARQVAPAPPQGVLP